MHRNEMFSLTAVVDVSQERLAEAKETYGVPGYTDVAEMIQAEKPDMVVIASPTHLHQEHACAATEMGVDVFLDKPMAQDYEATLEIVRYARETGRKLMVYQPHRARPEVNQLKKILESGKLGRLVSIQVVRQQYVRRADWQAFQKFGGGMLNNYGAVMSRPNAQGQMGLHLKWYDPQKLSKMEASKDLTAKNRKYNNDAPIPWVTEEIPLDPAAAVDFYGKVYEYYAEDKALYVPIEETLYVMELIRQCHENADEVCR